MSVPPESDLPSPPPGEVVERLVAGHREFLAFLERRIADRAAAEEILQEAFVRTLERGGEIRESESAVAWFYRVLRNALVDHYRHRGSERRALDAHALEPSEPNEPELRDAICGCIRTLLPNLKQEYAEMIARIDLDGKPTAEVASSLRITPNHASVRLHRARKALRRQLELSCGTCADHGCLDCTCRHA